MLKVITSFLLNIGGNGFVCWDVYIDIVWTFDFFLLVLSPFVGMHEFVGTHGRAFLQNPIRQKDGNPKRRPPRLLHRVHQRPHNR